MRMLMEIASDLLKTGKVPYTALPYVNAMMTLRNTCDHYGADDGKGIVLYALSNMSHMRHPDARRLKAELKQHAGIKLNKKEQEELSHV